MSQASLPVKTKVDSAILEAAVVYIQGVFAEHRKTPMFHSFSHAKETARVANDLAKAYDFSEGKKEKLLLATWFYFSGVVSTPKNFYAKSREIARTFLNEQLYSRESIAEVLDIMQEPCDLTKSLSHQILHDALISYTGRKRFFRKFELLRVERENLFARTYTDHDWEQIAYQELIKSDFVTDAGKNAYSKRKIKNIEEQRERVNDAHKVTTRQKTGKDLGRGVDTLYRTNYNNHINLSSIADGKANMMISINTLILSVIITLSGAGFSFSGHYIVEHLRFTVPVFILLLGSLASVVFAIMSARPKVTSHEINMEDVANEKSSLLFFGNFIQVPLSDYVSHLSHLKDDHQKLYNTMTVDIYYLGQVLDKKYSLLQWSYNIFMIALVLGVISFSFIFFYSQLS